MGLFDTVHIEQPIMQTGFHPITGLLETWDAVELLNIDPSSCQTKDFDNAMITYAVKDDKLYEKIPHFQATNEVNEFLTRVLGETTYIQKVTHFTYKDTEYHGDIHLSARLRDTEEYEIIHLIMRFTEGRLQWIREDAERMQWLAEYRTKREQENEDNSET